MPSQSSAGFFVQNKIIAPTDAEAQTVGTISASAIDKTSTHHVMDP